MASEVLETVEKVGGRAVRWVSTSPNQALKSHQGSNEACRNAELFARERNQRVRRYTQLGELAMVYVLARYVMSLT